jgi:hypothetical protein
MNKLFALIFVSRFSWWDVTSGLLIAQLVTEHSAWWAALVIPTVAIRMFLITERGEYEH